MMTSREFSLLLTLRPLTPPDVQRAVEYIERIAGDDEAAHGAEDSLREAVLTAIARGDSDAPALALASLKTGRLGFQRWTA